MPPEEADDHHGDDAQRVYTSSDPSASFQNDKTYEAVAG
jgi:hypothetical protein